MNEQLRGQATITVAYSVKGAKSQRRFTNPAEAQRFYTAQLKAGRNPTLLVAPTHADYRCAS